MNKKFILIPLLAAGLLIGCTSKPSSSSKPQDSSGTSSEVQKELWEQDLVEGESSFQQVKDAIDALEAVNDQKTSTEYFKVRGTVVFNSGATLAIYRNGQFLYCYNFNGDSEKTGNTDLEPHPLGAFVEVVALGSRYKTSPHQLFAYANSAYDPDAKLKVLSERGETITPQEISTGEQLTAALQAGGGMVKFTGAVAQADYTINGVPSANLDMNFKLADDTAFPVRLEKYAAAEEAALFNGTYKQKDVFTIVSYLSTQSSGAARAFIGGGCSITKTADGVWDEPTGVTVTAAESATSVEVGKNLQLTAVVAPAGAKQDVTWAVTTGATFAEVDQTGKVTGVAIGDIVVTATAKEGVAGTIALSVVASSEAPANAVTYEFKAVDLIADPEAAYTGGSVKLTSHKPTGEHITFAVTGGGNAGKIYKSNDYGFQIRLYSSTSDTLTITADEGYEIFSVKASVEVNNGSWWDAPADQDLDVAANKLSASLTATSNNLAVYSVTVVYYQVAA